MKIYSNFKVDNQKLLFSDVCDVGKSEVWLFCLFLFCIFNKTSYACKQSILKITYVLHLTEVIVCSERDTSFKNLLLFILIDLNIRYCI